jgi:nitrous oxide reductase
MCLVDIARNIITKLPKQQTLHLLVATPQNKFTYVGVNTETIQKLPNIKQLCTTTNTPLTLHMFEGQPKQIKFHV